MTQHAADKFSSAGIIDIRYAALAVSDSAYAAFWVNGLSKDSFDRHCGATLERLRTLADLCGFDLVEKPEADLRGDMAAARAREMNAELPAATSAILKVKGMIE